MTETTQTIGDPGTTVAPEFGINTTTVVTEGVKPQFGQEEIQTILKQNVHGQEHIKTLEGETTQLRDTITNLEQELANKKSMEEMIGDIQQQNYDPNSPGQTGPQLDETKLLEKVKEQVTAEMSFAQQMSIETSNMAEVQKELTEKHGTAYASYVDARSKELGMTNPQMEGLARINPRAFMELVSPGQGRSYHTVPSQTSPQSSQEDVEAAEYKKIGKLRKLHTEDGYEARRTWEDLDWQKKHRVRILETAKREGKF